MTLSDEGEKCGSPVDKPTGASLFEWKLWIYTNFDCNLSCTYCVAESSPHTPSRALELGTVQRLVDEALVLGFDRLFLTGGEPFMLEAIYDMLVYASRHVETTVLTNAMLLRGKRLQKLAAIANEKLIVQVSLDGARPEHHDAYRGRGTWTRTVDAIRRLQEHKVRIRLSTTETPANADHMGELHAFRRSLGITDEDHVLRPLTRRGFSGEGVEVGLDSLMPEVTVSADGVFWHPLASPSSSDLQVSREIFPLATAVDCIRQQLDQMLAAGRGAPRTVT